MDDLCIIKIEDKTKDLVKKFAEEVVKTTKSYIKNRNQYNIDKMIFDHYNGKLGEIAFWSFLSSNNDINFPDFKVTKNKTFNADLILNNKFTLHVKSQHIDSADRFGLAWVMQIEDKLVTEPNETDLYGLCLVDDDYVYIKKLMYSKDATYSEPTLQKLIGIKKVIRWEHNKDNNNFSEYKR